MSPLCVSASTLTSVPSSFINVTSVDPFSIPAFNSPFSYLITAVFSISTCSLSPLTFNPVFNPSSVNSNLISIYFLEYTI